MLINAQKLLGLDAMNHLSECLQLVAEFKTLCFFYTCIYELLQLEGDFKTFLFLIFMNPYNWEKILRLISFYLYES